MTWGARIFICVCAGLLVSGCASTRPVVFTEANDFPTASDAISRVQRLPPEVKARILLVDPNQVAEQEVRDLLGTNPAPRIINIHGGIFPIKAGMNSFGQFLVGMGYPEVSVRNPADGSFTYGYYDRSEEIAGIVAWYYERDGLRPMLVGHSQGGIQAIRVLYRLAGDPNARIPVWNPLTHSAENRYYIRDPLTGATRPVVGLQVSYATAALSGGLARLLPNQWDMNSRLRKIPDSAEEFTGFQKAMDPFGGDYLGFGTANEYHATGSAEVRNVRLPARNLHWTIPYAEKLLKDPALRQGIEAYDPKSTPEPDPGSPADLVRNNAQALWAAEVWYEIKKHWVLELQRLILAHKGSPS